MTINADASLALTTLDPRVRGYDVESDRHLTH